MLTSLALFAAVAGQWLCPASFEPLPTGWEQGNLGASPTTTTTDAWAHTGGFSNLNDIPAKGVYVWVLLSPRLPTSPAPPQHPFRLPLDLRQPDQLATQEGSTLPEYRFAGRYRGVYYVDVRVDFGRQQPTRWMFNQAQTLLRRLRLPSRIISTPARC
jgi:hypothetical protein